MANDRNSENMKIKKCPFCGGNAVIREWRMRVTKFMQHGSIGCDACGYSLEWSDIRTADRHDTDDEMNCLKRWDRRAVEK